jgi:N-carbamoyl-L-amino-acid hydrolase
LFKKLILSAGLEFRVDGTGNRSAYLKCGPLLAPTLLLGSHLDSVPNGGKYDGALGVLAALECLRVIKENNLSLPVNLEAIDFTDEEGTFIGLMGSSALVGKLPTEILQNPRGGRQELLAAYQRAGISEESALMSARAPHSLAGYIELHIEQGSRLLEAGADIGIVSAIVGISSYQLTFIGRADHAGTTPMNARLDASQGASAFTLAVRELILTEFPECVANIGNMRFMPGAFNIVPERVQLSLELRAADRNSFEKLENALIERAKQEALRFNLQIKIEHLGRHSPTLMDTNVQETIGKAASVLGLSSISLNSGAGHDAQSMAAVCPAGMIFVPSVNGASHSAREFTRWEDCLNGANVLLQACLILSNRLGR